MAESLGASQGAQKRNADTMRSAAKKAATTTSRDSAGRFTGNDDTGSNGRGKSSDSALSALASRLTALSGIGAGIEDADPTVKAFQEVAEPMRRGLEFFGVGKDDKQTGWLRKIFSKLNIFHKESSVYDKASTKVLKSIDEKSGLGGGEGDSFSGGAAGSIIGRLVPWLLGGLATAGTAIATVAGGALSTAIAAIFSPVGALVAAAGVAAWGVFTEDGRKFFSGLGGKMADSWNRFTDFLVESSPKTMEFLKNTGEQLGAAVDGVKATANKAVSVVAEQAKDAGNYLVKSSPVTMAALDKAGSYLKGKFDVLKAALGFGGGEITGLTDAQSRALAAETQRTESNGNPRAENKFGYIGKYQFGADALADGGLVDLDRLKAAKKASGKGWYQGGQTAFLNDAGNWKIAGGKEAFLSDSALQDKAFNDYTSRNIEAGFRSGALSKNADPARIAAYAKAAHLKGTGGANKLFLSGVDGVDANGTSASVYASHGSKAINTLAPLVAQAQARTVSAPSVPVVKMPSAGPIADAPQVVQPLGSGSDNRGTTINLPSQDVGRDLPHRGIAHIVTGGLSG
ncbi:hypothetical protein [Methylomonas albis]|uniref:Phage tail lysozyme domain-containing protein n=1 Tax=Methylomonas albis TaxID=1854563 RepID=A0ABR9D0Z5_9GAMM|nr:hypothetical protein [Methylomonas albis]MBD9356804.1 hypothetical protein [Methylomonas albis]